MATRQLESAADRYNYTAMDRNLLYLMRRVLAPGILLALLACSRATPTATSAIDTPGSTEITSTQANIITEPPPNPTPTEAPLAARVNGEGITLADYQAELQRYQAARGTELAPEDKQIVLDDLINQLLLAQAAREKGFLVEESMLQARMEALANESGGKESLSDWMQAQGYDEESFRRSLERSLYAAWMRDQILSAVPKTAEQVHARQILLYSREQAEEVYALLQAGNSFDNLALQYDPITGGELGWFPRGFLTDPGLEEVAFSLEVGAYSEVIETLAGYHIIQVLEREAERPLEADMLLALQRKALREWLEERRGQSEIEILTPVN